MSDQPQVVEPADQGPAVERETYPLDVVFLGGGPAGLAGAIHLAQRIRAHNTSGASQPIEAEIAVVEKSEEFGLHGLSGAILNTQALAELYPDFEKRGCPLGRRVDEEGMFFLTQRRAFRIPSLALPRNMHNRGLHSISLQQLTRWLAEQAEAEGILLLPGTSGVKILYEEDRVVGVRTGDKGLLKGAGRKPNFEPGLDLRARLTVFCEGPRGTLAEDLMARFDLRADCNPQQYSLGVKEIVRVPRTRGSGIAYHTLGYPLPTHAFGGGWIYEMDDERYSVGFVVGLDWKDPSMDAQEELQRFKSHPMLRRLLRDGEVLHYGAKTIPEGGYWAVPRLHAAGALVAGDSAGLVNIPTLKGIHYAMRSGILAADSALNALQADDFSAGRLAGFRDALMRSEVGQDLWSSRNFRSSFHGGLYPGLLRWGTYLFFGGGPRRRRPVHADWQTLGRASDFKRRAPRAKPDGRLYLDKLTDVHRSGTTHRDDAPPHIRILDPGACVERCIPQHETVPCEHFCPAKVFELQGEGEKRGIHIAFQNCVHCKTCVILDPCDVGPNDHFQNIEWRTGILEDAPFVCPECQSDLVAQDDPENKDHESANAHCRSCGAKISAEVLVEGGAAAYLDWESYVAMTDGGDSPLQDCPECGLTTYVLTEEQVGCVWCGCTLGKCEFSPWSVAVSTHPTDSMYSRVLHGWRDISSYLQVSVSTARRWHGKYRLPVVRVVGKRVFTSTSVIDRWIYGIDATTRVVLQDLEREDAQKKS